MAEGLETGLPQRMLHELGIVGRILDDKDAQLLARVHEWDLLIRSQ